MAKPPKNPGMDAQTLRTVSAHLHRERMRDLNATPRSEEEARLSAEEKRFRDANAFAKEFGLHEGSAMHIVDHPWLAPILRGLSTPYKVVTIPGEHHDPMTHEVFVEVELAKFDKKGAKPSFLIYQNLGVKAAPHAASKFDPKKYEEALTALQAAWHKSLRPLDQMSEFDRLQVQTQMSQRAVSLLQKHPGFIPLVLEAKRANIELWPVIETRMPGEVQFVARHVSGSKKDGFYLFIHKSSLEIRCDEDFAHDKNKQDLFAMLKDLANNLRPQAPQRKTSGNKPATPGFTPPRIISRPGDPNSGPTG